MLNFDPDVGWEANVESMTAVLDGVKTGEVTYAVRDTSIGGMAIAKGDIMGISDGDIQTTGRDVNAVTAELLAGMIKPDSELISIYYGADQPESAAEALVAELEESYPDCDIEVSEGAQPLYYYIVSVE